MADAAAPSATTTVTDRRPVPHGVLPRRMQTWIMAGVAAGMLLIMFVVGRPAPAARPASTVTAQVAPSPDRLRDYQDRLRVMETRAAQEAQVATSVPHTTLPTAQEPASASTPDPLVAERQRRQYESLFASNVVLSRRPAGQQPFGNDATSRGASPPLARDTVPPTPPNLDDVANAVVRATTRYSPPSVQGPSLGTAPPASAVTSTPAESPGGRRVPASTDPIGPAGPLHRLLEGTVIDTVLTNRLDGATASPVNCLVTNPIYSHSGQQVLIPAGSRVLGDTKAVQSVGESRLAVAFHRLILPDGRTVGLDQFTGLNQSGDAALRDQVNHHYLSTFGAASAVGVISGLGQYLGSLGLGQGSGDRTTVIAGGFGNATAESTAQVMNRFLNRLPTITIREGHRVKVYLTSDLELPAYDERRLVAPSTPARVP